MGEIDAVGSQSQIQVEDGAFDGNVVFARRRRGVGGHRLCDAIRNSHDLDPVRLQCRSEGRARECVVVDEQTAHSHSPIVAGGSRCSVGIRQSIARDNPSKCANSARPLPDTRGWCA